MKMKGAALFGTTPSVTVGVVTEKLAETGAGATVVAPDVAGVVAENCAVTGAGAAVLTPRTTVGAVALKLAAVGSGASVRCPGTTVGVVAAKVATTGEGVMEAPTTSAKLAARTMGCANLLRRRSPRRLAPGR